MQYHLQRTIAHICRKSYRCRLYSARSALQHASTEVLNESVPSTSSHLLDNTESLHDQKPSTDDGVDVSAAPNKVDAYLASLRVEGIEPTLADLERLATRRIPSTDSPKYAEAYNKTFQRLCRTFSKDQLRRFCHDLNLDSKSSRRKIDFAEAIMENAWGWKNLRELEEQKRDASEILVKAFPLPARELFLLLGKDGSELLRISKRYNVYISVQPDPLSIRIEGSRSSIAKIETMISKRRESVVEETVELPTGEHLPSSLLQHVSRTANAFIENSDKPGVVQILAMGQRRLSQAKRLACRTSVQIKLDLSTPFAALLPPPPSVLSLEESPSSYALFPFATQRSLPWTDASRNAFRGRKVSEWLGEGRRNFTLFSADLSGRKGKLIGTEGDIPGLENIISRSFHDSEGPYITTASTGHLLIMDESRAKSSILPPFPGRWQYTELLEWMKDSSVRRVFVPCLPLPLQSAPPAQEKIVHRLRYRRVQKRDQLPPVTETEFTPAEVLHAEVVINKKKLEEPEHTDGFSIGRTLDDLLLDSSVEQGGSSSATAEMGSTLAQQTGSDSDGVIDRPESLDAHRDVENGFSEVTEISSGLETNFAGLRQSGSDNTQEPHNASEVESSSEPICHRGRELELLISLPDRPMDLKLTVLGSVESLRIQDIPELDEYFKGVESHLGSTITEWKPLGPPLFIQHGEDRYILDLNANVRQSTESLDIGRETLPDFDSPRLDNLTERRILTTTESIHDLESEQKLVNCEITCKAAPPGEAWATFLTDIDRLTSVGYKSKHSSPAGNRFTLDGQGPELENQVF